MEQEGNLKEFDFFSVVKTIIKGRKLILLSIFIFGVLGLFVAVYTPNEYEASTIFVPQGAGSKKVGAKIGGLAAIAGINIGSGAEDSGIPLSLYSEIIKSIPFQRELIKTPITVSERGSKITYEEYYKSVYNPGLFSVFKKHTIDVPKVIPKGFKKGNAELDSSKILKKDSIIHITKLEKRLFNKLNKQLSLEVDKNESSIIIISTFPQAIPAAEIASNAQKLLEKYIIHFKIEKSITKLNFIRKRFLEKEKEYKRKQQQLANYQDRNKYSISARSQARLITLQAEHDLAYNVYNELATQVETQQIQVKEDTPIFTIIKPVSVPLTKVSPKRFMILMIWILIGLITSLVIIFGKKYFFELKNEFKKM